MDEEGIDTLFDLLGDIISKAIAMEWAQMRPR
jgi:hypothetical protein